MKFLICFLFTNIIFAQEIELSGQLICANISLVNIHIINLSNKKSTISNAEGKFAIMASEDDLLVFSAVNIDYWRQSVQEIDIKNKSISIKLTPKVESLQEVVVEKKVVVTAQEMGIINYKPKSYTQAERRLKAATDLNPSLGLGTMLGAAMSIDPLLNWISGRTKLLKKELKIEQKEIAIQKLDAFFDEKYFTNTLKIPVEYQAGFKFFAVEHQELYYSIVNKDKIKTQFYLAEVAQDFLNFLGTNP